MTLRSRGARRLALLVVAPLLAACSLDNETLGTRPDPAEGSMFRNYVSLGTSIGAGIQSGGINDSTQQEAYPYLLAEAMGLTPGVDWHYPSFTVPGCPAPYTNILTGARVGGVAATFCALRAPGSAASYMNNVSIPSLRAAQIMDVTDLTFGVTDTLKLAQFITGSLNPIEHAQRASATFVTLEVGANDVLGAATRGNAALLTPLADFQATFETIADELDALTGGNVAAFNVPNVTVIPHFSAGVVFFCLKTGAPGCPVPATPPFNSPRFAVSTTCAPGGAAPGALGDSMLVGFTATGAITSRLTAGDSATLDCGAATASVTTAAGTAPLGPVLSAPTVRAIATRVLEINAYIQAEASARGWAYVDLNGLLDSVRTAGGIPAFPSFTTPTTLFGQYISLDGIHPNAAAHRLLARRAAAAINTAYSTTVTVP